MKIRIHERKHETNQSFSYADVKYCCKYSTRKYYSKKQNLITSKFQVQITN